MGPIKEILAESQFQEELTMSSQAKLVVVDFTASWCGPCQKIAPFYEELSRKYPNAVFLKVDVDKCQETAVNQRVSVMPTFHFYRNKVKIDSMQGADTQKLEEKVLKYYDEGTGESEVGVAGHRKKEEKANKEIETRASESVAIKAVLASGANPEPPAVMSSVIRMAPISVKSSKDISVNIAVAERKVDSPIDVGSRKPSLSVANIDEPLLAVPPAEFSPGVTSPKIAPSGKAATEDKRENTQAAVVSPPASASQTASVMSHLTEKNQLNQTDKTP